MRRLLAIAIVLLLTAGTLLASARTSPTGTALAPPGSAVDLGGSANHRTAPSAGAAGAHPALASDPARGRTQLTGPLAQYPHPHPPAAVGPSYYGHFYAGSVYNDVNATATQLSTTIQIPLDVAQATDFYYVILSIWDNASSYDQLGFANSGGIFGVAYSTTDYCANN
jgi:hypothetical protein